MLCTLGSKIGEYPAVEVITGSVLLTAKHIMCVMETESVRGWPGTFVATCQISLVIQYIIIYMAFLVVAE